MLSIKCSNVPSYNFSKGDYMKLKTLLNETDWITDLQDLNVCESWNFLCYILNLQWNPLFQGTIERARKLSTENCHILIIKSLISSIRMNCSGKDSLELGFTQTRNSLRRLTHTLRSKFEAKIAGEVKNNPEAF